MAWAILRFAEAPSTFRRGLLRICLDEVRHAAAYVQHIELLGHRFGEFPVRDWFWDRVPASRTPTQFVACMGLGFEAGNLDHSVRFAQAFADAGDIAGAELQRRVGREEIGHVRFALHWFRCFEGDFAFERWLRELPAPLSPMVMRGRPVNRDDRGHAGLSSDFIDALDAWMPSE